VFNKVAYFTTYAPNTAIAPDPCQPGNLGTARLYAVDYKTGEAVLNYDTTNDTFSTINKRALSTPGQVLVRSDRVQTLGSGIPSGIVLIINPNGGLKALIGVGGVIPSENPKKGGSIIPLYWRQK
jgi:type IV pilus assembly protein PilY1